MSTRTLSSPFSITFLLITLCCFKSVSADNSVLQIQKAWIAESPPVSKVMVAYMAFTNTGPDTIEIIHAESDVYSSIEFHETIHQDGMSRMLRHESLVIAANKTLELKPGGPHLMLFNPTKRLQAGDSVMIKLTIKGSTTKDKTTNSCTTKTISVPVKKPQY